MVAPAGWEALAASPSSPRARLLKRAARSAGAASIRPSRRPPADTNLFCMGRDSANGRMRLGSNGLDVTWSYAEENVALIERMEEAMNGVATSYGGTFAALFTWSVFRRIITVHPLGGAEWVTIPPPPSYRRPARCTATRVSSLPTVR